MTMATGTDFVVVRGKDPRRVRWGAGDLRPLASG